MNEHLPAFERLSATLTGFSLADVQGTSLGSTYLEIIVGHHDPARLTSLLKAYDQLNINPNIEALSDEQFLELSQLNQEREFRSLINDIISLWYNGSWKGIPVSSKAYVEGFVWRAIGAHPMGAKQPGFGTWAFPPATFKI